MPEDLRKYDKEFQKGAVRIVPETGKSIAPVAVKAVGTSELQRR